MDVLIGFDENIHQKLFREGTDEVIGYRIKPASDNSEMRIAVSGNNTRRLIPVNTDDFIEIKILDSSGSVLPINDTFAVPIRRVGGAVERTIGVGFVDGVASKTINWPNSGEFEITEDLINMHLPPDRYFKFDRLVFSVYE